MLPILSFFDEKFEAPMIESFLNKTKFIEIDPHDTNDYDYELNKNGALIFDESGIHRASKPSLSDRLALRFTYKILSAPD